MYLLSYSTMEVKKALHEPNSISRSSIHIEADIYFVDDNIPLTNILYELFAPPLNQSFGCENCPTLSTSICYSRHHNMDMYNLAREMIIVKAN